MLRSLHDEDADPLVSAIADKLNVSDASILEEFTAKAKAKRIACLKDTVKQFASKYASFYRTPEEAAQELVKCKAELSTLTGKEVK